MNNIEVKFTKDFEDAITPHKGTEFSAGFDLHVYLKDKYPNLECLWIFPKETVKLPTGIHVSIPHGYFGAIFARSSTASNQGLRPANCVGIIDSDYTGELIMPFHNDSSKIQSVYHNDRIAQIIFIPYPEVSLIEVDKLEETVRGDGGFGSTGVN